MSLAVNFLTSSIGLPSNFSTSIDAAAWLMQQPSPLKYTSLSVPWSSICSSRRITSPHSGLVSSCACVQRETPPAMVRVFVVILDPFLVQFFLVGRHGVAGMSMEFVLYSSLRSETTPGKGRGETMNDER